MSCTFSCRDAGNGIASVLTYLRPINHVTFQTLIPLFFVFSLLFFLDGGDGDDGNVTRERRWIGGAPTTSFPLFTYLTTTTSNHGDRSTKAFALPTGSPLGCLVVMGATAPCFFSRLWQASLHDNAIFCTRTVSSGTSRLIDEQA